MVNNMINGTQTISNKIEISIDTLMKLIKEKYVDPYYCSISDKDFSLAVKKYHIGTDLQLEKITITWGEEFSMFSEFEVED
jgi:hypothetical protein